QLLESEGFLRIVPKHGILILHASAQRMSDLLELLMSLIIFAFEQNKRTKAAEITAIVDRFYDTHASAEAATPEQWAAAERDLWQQLVALGQNREMMHFFEVTLGKCRWDINVRRWKTAYRTETEACLRQLLASMVKKNDREGPDFFAYLFIWKKTWL
ncbi:MAG: GntR family transcriptional regulator, partial [Paenibacillus sp.]|nr:GntR family transcriptional regulator [Paenibacillus sp.]